MSEPVKIGMDKISMKNKLPNNLDFPFEKLIPIKSMKKDHYLTTCKSSIRIYNGLNHILPIVNGLFICTK
eukprot:GAHX01005234.1.p1 GENE.GAHX01005234.1~~GAHX01005234.1.p1  ORF type:complete len:70 (+),score=5.74 GAHX01005234.1:196-405(+)